MSTPPPTTPPRIFEVTGQADEMGPLVRQPAPAARLARIYHHAATTLWDLCTLADADSMREQARAVARLILATTKE